MIDIDKLEAGRELDAIVAEAVMGWIVCETADNDKAGIAPGQTSSAVRIPAYSTEISAAWVVFEKIAERVKTPGWIGVGTNNDQQGWSCDIVERTGEGQLVIWAPTAPLAICRAAIKAVGADK